VIGVDEDNFEGYVREVVSRHVPGIAPESFSTRSSRANSYLSVYASFLAENRAQVNALYEELGADPRVKMVL
jgi:putative lipoic acid-binding regulatory protein